MREVSLYVVLRAMDIGVWELTNPSAKPGLVNERVIYEVVFDQESRHVFAYDAEWV